MVTSESGDWPIRCGNDERDFKVGFRTNYSRGNDRTVFDEFVNDWFAGILIIRNATWWGTRARTFVFTRCRGMLRHNVQVKFRCCSIMRNANIYSNSDQPISLSLCLSLDRMMPFAEFHAVAFTPQICDTANEAKRTSLPLTSLNFRGKTNYFAGAAVEPKHIE